MLGKFPFSPRSELLPITLGVSLTRRCRLGPEVDVDRMDACFLCPPRQAGGPSFRPLGKVPGRKPQWTQVRAEPLGTGAGPPAAGCSLPVSAEATTAAPRLGQAAKGTNVVARGTRGRVRAPACPWSCPEGAGEKGRYFNLPDALELRFPPHSPTSGSHALCPLSLNQHLSSESLLRFSFLPMGPGHCRGSRTIAKGNVAMGSGRTQFGPF